MAKVRRIFAVAMMLMCVIFNFTSCNSLDQYKILHLEDEKVSNNKVTLRFISPWAGTDVKADALKRVLEMFMENNPNIEVINESMSGEDFLVKLKTDFVSGNDPDVFGIWPGSNMMSLIKAGKVADLTPLLDNDSEWKKSFDKSVWYYVTVDNKTYGLPLEIIYQCLFINKDMFEAYHVKVPENFNELKQAVVSFRSQGVIPIAYNAESEGNLIYQNIIASLGGRIEVEQPFKNGKVNDCYLQAADYMKELYELGAFPANAFNLDNKSRDDLFLNKQAAMIVQGSEFIGEVNKQWTTIEQNSMTSDKDNNTVGDKQITVDMIPFPSIEGGKADPTALIYGLGSGTFFMSQAAWSDDVRKEASIKLLQFLTSKESATLFVERTRMLSSVKIPPPNVYYSGLMRRGSELIDNTKELIAPPDSFFDRSIWESTVVDQLPYVLEGKQDSQKIWEEVLKSYNANK